MPSLERHVLTDNRMHAWEWLVTPEGRILKADALDHHRGNDLVGPQDVAWDLAGAAVELELDEDGLERLSASLIRARGTAWSGSPTPWPAGAARRSLSGCNSTSTPRPTSLSRPAATPSPPRPWSPRSPRRRPACAPRWNAMPRGC